jgi:hypothetical protein
MIHSDGRRTIADNTPRDFTPKPDLVSQIMDYESGELSEEDTVSLFQRLIDSGHGLEASGELRPNGASFHRVRRMPRAKFIREIAAK